MILTKSELIEMLQYELKLVLHLATKVGPAQLDYAPSENQRTTLDLLRYLSIMGPIHTKGILGPAFDMAVWGQEWSTIEATAKMRDFEQTVAAINEFPQLFEDLISGCSDDFLSEKIEMFGSTNSRTHWLLSLVLTHYAAYRMQLFLYLKASGHPELNTMNLWVGTDGSMKPPFA